MTQMNDVTGRTTPPTVPEREKAGHEARERTPIASLGTYTSGSDRPDPLTLLESQSESRVPFLVPVRYGRMLVSPFTFYRGAALIMASDLSSGPRTDLQAQLCGDAHLANFGGFATPERRLIFDINDFDETNPGPFEWDVKRLAASMEVAARDHGFKKKERAEIVRSTAEAYRTTMAELATQGRLDVWYATLDMDATLDKYRAEMKADELKRTGATIAKARTRTSLQAANKLTTVVNGQRRFIDNPPVVERAETLLGNAHFDMAAVAAALQQSWADYVASLQPDRRVLLSGYTYVDLAMKVVGVGSVGTRAWIVLLQGRDETDLLILQLKEAQASVLEAFTKPSAYSSHGERVVQGQRLLQSASDIFLGWTTYHADAAPDTDYYIRQLRDWKASADIDNMGANGMRLYGRVCAATLAKGHARSGDRIAIATYLGGDTAFDEAVLEFSQSYADQNEADFARLKKAADDGVIKVQYGV